jgi:hypothetical protein
VSVIEAYIAELDRALHGPRRVKADLLAEGRDSLVDAAESFEGDGLDREAAEQQAVEEFGQVREIAPGYQAELAFAQGRRTALLVAATMAVHHAAAEIMWRSLAQGWAWSPGHGYRLLARAVDVAGGVAVAVALLAALAFGVGARYVGTRPDMVRATGRLVLVFDALLVLAGLALTGLNPATRSLEGGGMLWALCAFSAIPAAWVAASARRCLRVA